MAPISGVRRKDSSLKNVNLIAGVNRKDNSEKSLTMSSFYNLDMLKEYQESNELELRS